MFWVRSVDAGVLVEGYSKAAIKAQEAEQTRGEEVEWRRSNQLVGRTRGDQIVVFAGEGRHIGRFVDVRVHAATALTLHGSIVDDSPQCVSMRGRVGGALRVLGSA